MSLWQRTGKRIFDLVFSLLGLLATWWIITIAIVIATIDTRRFGLFWQTRVGREGKLFKILKIRSMRDVSGQSTTVTTSNDLRITRFGSVLRKFKIDELPQLLNVLLGDMSFVGPRPDVPGFADRLEGRERLVLSVRPGITGPASLYFRNEEELLSTCDDPEKYNEDVIFPKKVALNMEYIENYRFRDDLKMILQTITGN